MTLQIFIFARNNDLLVASETSESRERERVELKPYPLPSCLVITRLTRGNLEPFEHPSHPP